MERDNYDYMLKLVIIGNSNAGKSCLLHYFLENKFKKTSTHTIGVEFGSKILKSGQKSVKLQIWDTAGQERFRSMTKTYYRCALGALIVFDLSNLDTYSTLEQWIKDAKDLARPDISLVVIGNKKDLKQLRAVEMVDAAKFCQEQGVQYIETSALNGENVEEAFNLLTKNILVKIEQGLINTEDLKPKLFTSLNNSTVAPPPSSGCRCRNV